MIKPGLFAAIVALLELVMITTPAFGQQKGRIQNFVFNSAEITIPRIIEVWLPSDYDPSKKYAVIYMHDGQSIKGLTSKLCEQMAADTTEGGAARNNIKPFIIVGISNRDNYRFTEYFPQKALDGISKTKTRKLVSDFMIGQPMSDTYLRFIVNELKPHIDKRYPTIPDRDNTFIMGYSMGGLISIYAICEYPEVFGGAVCLSTHWPLTEVAPLNRTNMAHEKSFMKYLEQHLPDPSTHRIYYDHGTKDLDSCYAPHQKRVDRIMKEKGYTKENWITMVFPGEDHTLRSWSKRLYIPLEFILLGKEKQ